MTETAKGSVPARVALDHVHLFASDLAAAVGFIRTMFGATVVWDGQAAGVRYVRLALGRGFVNRYDQPPKAPRGGAFHHVGIETDDLDALVAHMRAHGVRFRHPVRDEPKFRYVRVAGPDDRLVELFECREPGAGGRGIGGRPEVPWRRDRLDSARAGRPATDDLSRARPDRCAL